MKGKTLVLNKFYFPVGHVDWRKAVEKICAERMFPLDIQYNSGEDGSNLEAFEWCQPIATWKEWCNLPIRPFDEYIQTSKGVVRAPSVVICAAYDKVKWHKVLFPTKQNIWARDNYTCAYTGKKLNREDLSVDHIVPRSKGGEDTWMNLVTCDKMVNCKKGDMDLKDFHLKLKNKPFVPKNTVAFPILRPEWSKFVAESAA